MEHTVIIIFSRSFSKREKGTFFCRHSWTSVCVRFSGIVIFTPAITRLSADLCTLHGSGHTHANVAALLSLWYFKTPEAFDYSAKSKQQNHHRNLFPSDRFSAQQKRSDCYKSHYHFSGCQFMQHNHCECLYCSILFFQWYGIDLS